MNKTDIFVLTEKIFNTFAVTKKRKANEKVYNTFGIGNFDRNKYLFPKEKINS